MSTTPESFYALISTQIAGLSLPDKVHTLWRLYEKLRKIHNAVGDVYRHRKTILEFKAEYPTVFGKISGELQPYIDGNYLSQEGWNYFLFNMFEPRHGTIMQITCELLQEMKDTAVLTELEPFQ